MTVDNRSPSNTLESMPTKSKSSSGEFGSKAVRTKGSATCKFCKGSFILNRSQAETKKNFSEKYPQVSLSDILFPLQKHKLET
jgi:hypothetical protein